MKNTFNTSKKMLELIEKLVWIIETDEGLRRNQESLQNVIYTMNVCTISLNRILEAAALYHRSSGDNKNEVMMRLMSLNEEAMRFISKIEKEMISQKNK